MLEVRKNGNLIPITISNPISELKVNTVAPNCHWSNMGPSDHFAQFYEGDGYLMHSLHGYVKAGLIGGDAVVVVGTGDHRARLQELLESDGIDVVLATASGQYLALDAAETLDKFMVAGEPNAKRFKEVIGTILARASEGRERVRAFGEMVALLWADGNHEAAIALEGLWNDLQKVQAFSLFCGYPLNGFKGEQLGAPLGRVCTAHSQVIPAESYVSLASPDERMQAIIRLQQKANSLESEVSERRKAEESLRLLKEQLEQQLAEREHLLDREKLARAEAETANRMKDEFLATVSHELRTPLNAIIGWAHMLRSGRLDEATVVRAVETIERNAKSQAQLVEDILDVSRVITGKLRLNTAPVDLAAVINSSIDSVQLAAESKDIHLEVTLSPSARHATGDAARLQQVVWNLLSNAIKFTPNGGRVEVRLEHDDGNVKIKVSDSGPGISPEFLPFIFDRFRQADGTSTRRHGGLGLGLAIVRHLVELHGGTVAADCRGEGPGAVFTVSLPLSVSPDGMPARSRGSRKALSNDSSVAEGELLFGLDRTRVLLVDDDPDSLQVLSALLEEQHATVQATTSADEAIEAIEWYKPDVVIANLAMPGKDGYDLIAKIRELDAIKGSATPAVALTSYVRVEDRTHALAAGFNMFVPKPVQPNELITAISNLVQPSDASI